MKKTIIGLLALGSISAFADSLRIEKDIVFTRSDSLYLSFVVNAPSGYATYCNLQGLIRDASDSKSLTLKQGTELKIVVIKQNQIYRDVSEKYEISSVMAEISHNNFLKAVCSAKKGTKKIPTAYETASLFSDYISITR